MSVKSSQVVFQVSWFLGLPVGRGILSQLNVKLNSSESKVDNLEKIILLKNGKICELKTYTEKIEAKLSDVKDFVFKNCSDLLDSFNNTFNSY